MRTLAVALLILLALSTPLRAEGPPVPDFSPSLEVEHFFDPDRLLTNGGMGYRGEELTLEPEWGVGYRTTERESSGGIAESTHQVHAQAGWRLSLPDLLYVSAAAKLPVVTLQTASRISGQDLGSRQDYDFTHPFRNTPTWTGEMGLHFSSWTDLTLYYDQSPVSGLLNGGPQQEERIGTRLIFKFK